MMLHFATIKYTEVYALDKETKEPVTLSNAKSRVVYLCPECKFDVILKNGSERSRHFAHKSRIDENKCHHYGAESIDHRKAKDILSHILQQKTPITIKRKCYECQDITTILLPEILDTSIIEQEYPFRHDKCLRRADIAHIDNGQISSIYEIYHSSKTEEWCRPEPWVEIDDEEIINLLTSTSTEIKLTCLRERKCKKCETHIGKIYFNQRGAGCGKTYESIQLLQDNERYAGKNTFIYLSKTHSAIHVIEKELEDQQNDGKLKHLKKLEADNNSNQSVYEFVYTPTNKTIRVIVGTIDSFIYHTATGDRDISMNMFMGMLKNIQNSSFKNNPKYGGSTIPLSHKTLIIIDEAQDLPPDYIKALDTIREKTNIDISVIGDKLQSIYFNQSVFTYLEEKVDDHIIKDTGKNQVRRFHNEQFSKFVNKVVPYKKYKLPAICSICPGGCKYKHENEKEPYKVFITPTIYSNEEDYNLERISKIIDRIITYMNKEIDEYSYLPNNFMFIFPILTRNALANQLRQKLQQFWINKIADVEYREKIKEKIIGNSFWLDDNGELDITKFRSYCQLHKSEDGQPINLDESENATRILSIHASKGQGCEVVFLLGVSEKSLNNFSKQTETLIYESLLHVAITRQKKALYMGIDNKSDDIYKRFKLFIESAIDEKPTYLSRPKIQLKYVIDNAIETGVESKIIDLLKRKNIRLEGTSESNTQIHGLYKTAIIETQNLCEDDICESEIGDLQMPSDDELELVNNEEIPNSDFEDEDITHVPDISELDFTDNTDEPIDKSKVTIDWGHHTIRYSVTWYQFISRIINEMPRKTKTDKYDLQTNQFLVIFKEIIKLEFAKLTYVKYNQCVRHLYNQLNKKYDEDEDSWVSRKCPKDKCDLCKLDNQDKIVIPILSFKIDNKNNHEYAKYSSDVYKIIKCIFKKGVHALRTFTLPKLCALETVVYMHIYQLYKLGPYSDINIMAIYDVMYCYNHAYSKQDTKTKTAHCDEYKCECSRLFDSDMISGDRKLKESSIKSKQDKITSSILNHYMLVEKVDTIYKNYTDYLSKVVPDAKFKYNFDHKLSFGVPTDRNFYICDVFTLIGQSKQPNTPVIVCNIVPSFSQLNISSNVYNNLLRNQILSYLHEKEKSGNYAKYANKKILNCFITLTDFSNIKPNMPLFYDLTLSQEDDNLVLNTLKDYIIKEYTNYHNDLWQSFEYYKPKFGSDDKEIAWWIDKLLPVPYVKEYFKRLHDDVVEGDKTIDEIIAIPKTSYVEKLEKKLNNALNTFTKKVGELD